MKYYLVILTLFFTVVVSAASIATFKHGKKRICAEKFEVIDITFQHKKQEKTPFELDMKVDFMSPSGKKISVQGFYNGGKEWVVRFSANELGKWQYISTSSSAALNGKKGFVKITESSKGKHGAIIVDKTKPKKFAYEDGIPYMLQAFEIDWLFALDYDNSVGTPKSEHILKLLANNGINQIVTTLYSYDVRWKKDEKLKQNPHHDYSKRNDIYPFLGSNKKPDFSALNVTFFKRFDRMVQLMHENDLVAHLMVYVWNKKVKWPKANSKEDNRFFDYVIKRYSAFPNVIWNVSKEAFRHEESYMLDRIDRTRKIDPFNRLVTIHDFKKPTTVDFISLQDWSITLYTNMLEEYNTYNIPVINIEHGGYANATYTVFPGDYINPEINLRRNYLCYFAGVYANYYWQDLAWNVMVHNPFELSEEFVKPRLEYYKYLKAFFSKYNYQEFYPSPKDNKSAYCLKNKDGVYLYFLTKDNYQLSSYSKKGVGKPSGTYQWFNIETGKYTDKVKYTNGHFVNPFHGKADAILIRNIEE